MRPAEEVKVNPIATAHRGYPTLLAVFFLPLPLRLPLTPRHSSERTVTPLLSAVRNQGNAFARFWR